VPECNQGILDDHDPDNPKSLGSLPPLPNQPSRVNFGNPKFHFLHEKDAEVVGRADKVGRIVSLPYAVIPKPPNRAAGEAGKIWLLSA
jgi:hypothetical protein